MMEAIASQSSSSSASTTTSADAVADTRHQYEGITVDQYNGKDGRRYSSSSTHISDNLNYNYNCTTEHNGSVSISVHHSSSVPPSQGSILANPTNIASKADRLKEIELIESYFLGVPTPVVLDAKSANAAENYNESSTMEILHEHLLESNDRKDDERLLNLIMQPCEEKRTSRSIDNNLWDQAPLERVSAGAIATTDCGYSSLGNIHEQTTIAMSSNRPRLSSSLSQINNAATENYSNPFDASNMNSTAWKPDLQIDHLEIPYSPAHIFADRFNGKGSTTATRNSKIGRAHV